MILNWFLSFGLRRFCIASLMAWGSWVTLPSVIAQSSEYPDDISASERSTVRRAITPSNRKRVQSVLRDEFAPSEDAAEGSRLSSTSQPIVNEIQAVPETAPDTSQPTKQPVDESSWVDEQSDYYDTGESIYDDPAGSSSCDGMGCGNSICNSSCGGAPACFAFHNPLADPTGFTCSLANRMQFRIAAANFWTTGSTLPVLATSDTDVTRGPNGVALLDTALQSVNTTSILFGGTDVLNDSKAGVRADLTLFLDDCKDRGLWLRLYDSGNNNLNASFDSTTNSVLARPFNNITSGTLVPATNLLTFPSQRRGSLDIALRSVIQGGDLLLRNRMSEDDMVRNDFLCGYQKVRLAEDLRIESTSTVLPTTVDSLPPGTRLELTDTFATSNQFNGGQIGWLRSAHDGCWYFDGMAKIGFGRMNRTVSIDGFSTSTVPANQVNETTDGLLARRTNNGTFEDNTFVLIPELSLNAAYLLTDSLHFTVGYTYLRLPKVTRVGDAIDADLAVNLSNPLVGEVRPNFDFFESNVNVHSLDLGLQYRY